MNYRDWCEAMRIAPHFVLQATAPPDLYEETRQIEVRGLCSRLVPYLPPARAADECAHSAMESVLIAERHAVIMAEQPSSSGRTWAGGVPRIQTRVCLPEGPREGC